MYDLWVDVNSTLKELRGEKRERIKANKMLCSRITMNIKEIFS